MTTKLYFANGDISECEILGSVYINNISYAVFLDVNNKDLYIYKYTKKKNKYKLFPVKDKDEFRNVCRELNMIVNREERGAENGQN